MRDHLRLFASLLISIALAGCGDGLSTSSSGGDLRDVEGTFVDTHLTEAGESTHPIDPSTVTLSALVADAKGFTSHAGTLGADGTFTVPGVPEGEYYLEIAYPDSAPTFLVTTERILPSAPCAAAGSTPWRPRSRR